MAVSSSTASPGPFYEKGWFEVLFLALCLGIGYFLFQWLAPPVQLSSENIQSVALGRLLAEGRLIEGFTRFNQPPVYPVLIALLIKFRHTTEMPALIEGLQELNRIFYLASVTLVYWFIRRQIRKPYPFAVTALYMLVPATLHAAWALGPDMTFITLIIATLLAIDYSMGTSSALGSKFSRGELIGCSALLVLSILTRQMGYTLLAAFFLVLLKRMGLKKSAMILAAIVLAISPFIARDLHTAIRQPQTYTAPSATFIQTANRQGLFKTLQATADQLLMTATHHAVGELDLSLVEGTGFRQNVARMASVPIRRSLDITYLPWGRWLLGGLAIIGMIYGLYQFTGIGSLFLCTYLITALVLLPKNPLSLTPTLPLILFYLYMGIMQCGDWSKRIHVPLSRILGPALTVWILLCAGTAYLQPKANAGTLPHTPKLLYVSTAREPESRLQAAQENSAHRRAMQWLEKNAPVDAKVGASRPQAASLLGKPGRETTSLTRELGQYDYLLEKNASKMSPARRKSLARNMSLVYEDVPGRIRIWKVLPVAQ